MTPLDYIKIGRNILTCTDISSTGKMLLGLIHGCNSQGLHIPNADIAELLGIENDTVTKLLRDLLSKGLIRIKNPQSRYRKIFYSGKKSGVKSDSTPEKNRATPENNPFYSGKKSGHNLITKNKRCAEAAPALAFDFSASEFRGITPADITRWSKAYPGVNIETEILKAAEWLLANPARAKSNYRRFLTSWFGRCKPTAAPAEDNFVSDPDTIDKIFAEAGL